MDKDFRKQKILNTILQETKLLENLIEYNKILDLLSGKINKRRIITDIYGNGESLPSNFISNKILNKIINKINTMYNNLPYLVMKGEIITKDNTKYNLYIVYLLLDKVLVPQKRSNYIKNITSNIGVEFNILGRPFTIPKN